MHGQCRNCRRIGQVVFANRHGVQLCLRCLEAYLAERRREAGLLAGVAVLRVVRPDLPRSLALPGGVRVVLDGRIPTVLTLGGKRYHVCLSPTNGNGGGSAP